MRVCRDSLHRLLPDLEDGETADPVGVLAMLGEEATAREEVKRGRHIAAERMDLEREGLHFHRLWLEEDAGAADETGVDAEREGATKDLRIVVELEPRRIGHR